MKLCADAWFFVEISEKSEHAIKLLEKIENNEHEHELFVPALVISEFVTVLYQRGMSSLAAGIYAQIMASENISVIPIDAASCIKIAKIKHSFGLSLADAAVLAAYKSSNSDILIAKDSDYAVAVKQRYVNIKIPQEFL